MPAGWDLTGTENRSELIFGAGAGVQFEEGDEYWYGFSFNIQQMVYGHPGAHNLIMQFKSEGRRPQLRPRSLELRRRRWPQRRQGGCGPKAETAGGNRFLAPVSEQQWHDVAIHFKASSHGSGFYEIFLDGHLVDSRSGVSMIVPGRSAAYIKDGLYRNGATNPGTSEILLDAAKLGTTTASVQPMI